jgi:hypothetical protein
MPSLERQSDSGGRSVDAACGCPAFNFLIGGEPYARGFDIRRSSRASASGRITMPCRVHCQPACPTRPSRLVREHDANTTVTNGCPRAQTRRTSSSGEMAIYLHQRIRPPIRAHVTLSAHNPKVAGSNPAPATNARPAQRPFLELPERASCYVDVPRMYHADRSLRSPTARVAPVDGVHLAAFVSRWRAWTWSPALAPTRSLRPARYCSTATVWRLGRACRNASCAGSSRNAGSPT